ncbi:MAG: TetR/AcrR family transcriptional regulator [Lautropia sp.]
MSRERGEERSAETGRPDAACAARPSRLDPDVRRRQILDAAISYFAEAGFTVQTRELTRRIGVSQPLLYRYFPSKQALIQAVFEAVFLNRWDDRWLVLLRDRAVPLRERLLRFYREYIAATYQPEWLRIYMYSGLAGFGFNRDYVLRIVEDKILTTVCEELRRECLPPRDLRKAGGITPREIELAWTLQGSAFYWVVRRSLFNSEPVLDFDTRFGDSIDLFLAGARAVYPGLMSTPAPVAGKRTPRGRPRVGLATQRRPRTS